MFINQILTKLKSLVYSKSETDSLLNGKASSSHTHTKSQITDFPTIPSKTSQLTNDSGFLTAHQSLSDYSTKANTVKSLSISGKTITVTPGSGNVYTLTTQDTVYTHPTTAGNKHIPSGGSSGQFLGWSADGTAKWVNNPNTNTWTAMVGATSSANGSVGYVNAVPPKDGYNTKYLRADGTWQVPPDHTYTVNNATLTIQKNGTTVNSFTANASSNVTANITVPTKTSELTNNSGYITSSSNITGNAATATKLATARSISAGDLEFQGSANFDGSSNIKLNITQHRSMVTIGNTNNYPFHRIAYTAQETGNYVDRVITFFVGKEYISAGYGICRIVLRTNNASGGATAQCEVQWLVRTSGIPVDAIQVGFNNRAAASYVDVFYKSSGSYHSAICRVISHASSRTNVGQGFTVVSTSSEVDNTTASNPLTSTESYATIAAAGTKIRGKAYTSTITASDAGIANYATYNANGKELVNSIIKGLSVSGRTITYTKLDGTTGTLTTQDTNTTYSNFVKSGSGAKAGLVPAPSTTAGTTKYLREDGTWQVPPDHTYTVNNATLTIQKNGTNVATFTSNASSNVTANISVPTKVSQLTNDSGFLTSANRLPIGSYIQFAGSQAPDGFLVCNGGAISRTTYSKLFAVIGTKYGKGNGSTTFNLPNLTDRFLQGSTTSGTVKNAGLPNITGTSSLHRYPVLIGGGTGSLNTSLGSNADAVPSTSPAQGMNITFNASQSNSIYGNSTTVQPPALTCLICIKY